METECNTCNVARFCHGLSRNQYWRERYHQGRQLKLLEFAEFAEFAEFSGVTMGLW